MALVCKVPSRKGVGHEGTVLSLLEVPKLDQLISGSADTTIRIWNLKDVRKESKDSGVTEVTKELYKLVDNSDAIRSLT